VHANATPPKRRTGSRALSVGITLVVSTLVWLLVGLGKPGYLGWKSFAFSCFVGFSIYGSCRAFDWLWGARIARQPVRRQGLWRAAIYFLGGCLGYVVGIVVGAFLFGGITGKPGKADVLLLGVLGTLATVVGLGFHFYGLLEDRLRQSVARLHEAELAEKELALARTIQQRLQPPAEIERDGFRVSARNLPAAFVAGDFYDVFHLGDGAHGIVVADVSGKGMGAALIMATVKSRLPLLAAGRTVAETLAALNESLVDELAAREFVALIYARYDAGAGVLEIANAGLPDPYLVVAGSPPLPLVVPGERLPLGMRRRLEHRALRVELPRGARVLFLTDGVPEAPVGGEPLGYEAFVALLPQPAPLAGWLDALVAAVEKRSPGPRSDDWTLLALERVIEP